MPTSRLRTSRTKGKPLPSLHSVLRGLCARPALNDELRAIAGRLGVTLEEVVAVDDGKAIAFVAGHYEIPASVLLSKERRDAVKKGRHQCWSYCVKACHCSLEEVALWFGRTVEEIRQGVAEEGPLSGAR